MSKGNKRQLKVYYGHHGTSRKPHPFIRLAGKYLSQFDFKIGDNVEITMAIGRITITNKKIPETVNGD